MTNSNRREFMSLAASTALLGLWSSNAGAAETAEQFPTKPIRLLYPFPPGGGADVVVRVLAQDMQKTLGQSIVVDNRPGAGAAIAAQALATAAPDGYTILVAPTGIMSITPHLRKLAFETRDFVPIARFLEFKGVLIVANSVPANTVQEFIAYAKANPGKISYATSGIGTQGHLSGVILEKAWGIQMTHVPYKGAAEILSDLLTGRVSLIMDTGMLPQVKAGKMRLLANVDNKRLPDFPNVPAITELPIPQPQLDGVWNGVFAPKGTPAAIVQKIATAFERALQNPELPAKMQTFAMQPAFLGPKEFAAYCKSQYDLYGRLIREADIRVTE